MALHRGSLASVRCEEDVRAASIDWTFITSELGQVTHTEIAQKTEGLQNTLPRNNSYDLTCCVCFEVVKTRIYNMRIRVGSNFLCLQAEV